jgi:hypothetical protein
MQVGRSFLLVPTLCCSCSCRRRSRWEGVDEKRVDDGDILDSDAFGEGKADDPRASTRMLDPLAEVLDPLAEVLVLVTKTGGRRRGGSKVDAMPARCTTLCKIPFRILCHNAVKAARDEHRMAWSAVLLLWAAPQQHSSMGAFRGIMLRPRRLRRRVRTSPALG